MLADFFTKPLQGELFRFFRNIIMGYISTADIICLNPGMKEHVGKWNKFRSRLIPEFENNNNNDEHSDEDPPIKILLKISYLR